MTRTDRYNDALCLELSRHHIKHSNQGTFLLVDRDSMLQHYSASPRWQASQILEEAAYAYALRCVIKPACQGAKHVCWGSRSDDWLGVEVYE